VSQAAQLTPGGIGRLGFSGGEPFLLRNDLVEIVRFAREHSVRRVECNTAVYWANSTKAARQRLEPLRAAGLDRLTISTDDFHTEFIKLENVRIALEVAQELGIEVAVNSVVTQKTRSQAEILQEVGDIAAGLKNREWHCQPSGVATDFIPLDDLFLEPGIPQASCPAPNFVIRPDGDAYFCCSPSGWTPDLKLGNALEEPLDLLWSRFQNRELSYVLLQEGPSGFVPAIQRDGREHLLRSSYVNVCHLCHHILSNPELRQSVQAEVTRREIERTSFMLQSLLNAQQPIQDETHLISA
jgi:MoaA/NifB/PqqE/SkfB family radical SAM enzyme